jgi:hypothetical protein
MAQVFLAMIASRHFGSLDGRLVCSATANNELLPSAAEPLDATGRRTPRPRSYTSGSGWSRGSRYRHLGVVEPSRRRRAALRLARRIVPPLGLHRRSDVGVVRERRNTPVWLRAAQHPAGRTIGARVADSARRARQTAA